MDNKLTTEIKENNKRKEKLIFSPYACFSEMGLRKKRDKDDSDVRSKFFHDTDRIIHSNAYSRYIDKTQVFYLVNNDHITHRVLHVQLVSKIGREIGRELSLNEDLIEAIALGHDIGHTPYGHEGEDYLSKLSTKYGIKEFHHNVQSVRVLQNIEKKGKGLNLTLQVVDGILCHNGEIVNNKLIPNKNKTWKEHEAEVEKQDKRIVPMTLEGCVVRFSDIIGYIGRDIEDAIKIGIIKRKDLPKQITDILGNNNREIINTLVLDIVETSYKKNFIGFNEKVYRALKDLKDFNYTNIYNNPKIKTESPKIERMFNFLFETFYSDINNENTLSPIYKDYLLDKNENYKKNNHPALIVRDFISGMTDDYFNDTFKRLFLPNHFGNNFRTED